MDNIETSLVLIFQEISQTTHTNVKYWFQTLMSLCTANSMTIAVAASRLLAA